MHAFRWSAALALIALSAPGSAQASELTIRSQYEPESRAHQLDLVVSTYVAGGYVGFVPGLLYGFPVAPQGFISSLNDAFYIEAGLFLGAFFDPTFFWMTPVAGVRWCFYLTKEWAVFAAVRLGWSFEFDDEIKRGGFYADGTIGAHWHFSDTFALRLETGGARFGYRAIVGISWQIGM